jgi:hypothetical protein
MKAVRLITIIPQNNVSLPLPFKNKFIPTIVKCNITAQKNKNLNFYDVMNMSDTNKKIFDIFHKKFFMIYDLTLLPISIDYIKTANELAYFGIYVPDYVRIKKVHLALYPLINNDLLVIKSPYQDKVLIIKDYSDQNDNNNNEPEIKYLT